MTGSDVVIGVGAVVLKGNKILLVKRRNPPCKGYWSIPGGRVEPGEKLVDAVKRELYEETGLESEPIGILWVADVFSKCMDDSNKHYVIIDFLMKPVDTSIIKPGDDALDARFYDIHDTPVELTPSTKELINYISKLLDKGLNYLYDKVIVCSDCRGYVYE